MENGVSTSVLFWIMFHDFIKSEYDSITTSRIYSSTHATLTFLLSLLYLLTNSSMLKHIMISIPIGYSIVDLMTLVDKDVYKTTARFTIPHHAMLICMLWKYASQHPDLAAMGLLSEITNPMINYGQHLIQYNRDKNKLFKLGCVLVPSFIVFRILNFFWITYLMRKKGIYIGSWVSGVMTLLNLYWFRLLIKKGNEILS